MNQRQLQVIEYLREENRVLREQFGERRLRLSDDQRRRLAAKAKGLGRKLLRDVATIVTPETLLRWLANAQKYDGSGKRGVGRPRTIAEIEQLVVQMAEENRSWGSRRIQGALSNLGYKLARSTIAAILARHGIEPAPERTRKTTWKEFLTQHWELIAATDFFTIEVWTAKGLQRFIVLFFIELSTRECCDCWNLSGRKRVVDEPDCMESDRLCLTACSPGECYLIHDRDPLFTDEFLSTLTMARDVRIR